MRPPQELPDAVFAIFIGDFARCDEKTMTISERSNRDGAARGLHLANFSCSAAIGEANKHSHAIAGTNAMVL